jgi:hypothetical protein
MKHSILPIMFIILTALLSSVSLASSQPNVSLSSSYILLAQNNQSLDSAVQSIKQQTGGRILSAKTVVEDGQRIHKIKVLLPSGKIQTFKISAQ